MCGGENRGGEGGGRGGAALISCGYRGMLPPPSPSTHASHPLPQFVVLGTAGLWDVLSPLEAVSLGTACLHSLQLRVSRGVCGVLSSQFTLVLVRR